ncbi:hypothetical protein PBRA_009347 [Plasmodiophora brassicae]|uniref:Uncharacterized protein n=1 Tax=Plasmodiophora brassicae TaxID=37360 RepID=A0A0G4J719_PLABS|nr:hypothetical protein PBRA_009347 [Plasmodiophora brassicae]
MMNSRLDQHEASDTLVELVKVISHADLATSSFDAGIQHDADDFVLELIGQMQAYSVIGANGQPIHRAIVGFVEHVVGTCATSGRGISRPPCDVPVVMLGGSRGRTIRADALLVEHTTTIARRCTSERPCKRVQDVEHRSTTVRQLKGKVEQGQVMLVRQDPIVTVQEPGLDSQMISTERRGARQRWMWCLMRSPSRRCTSPAGRPCRPLG